MPMPFLRCASSTSPTPIRFDSGDSISMFVGWEYGEYFWDAILDAGETLGIGPRTPVQTAVSEAVA